MVDDKKTPPPEDAKIPPDEVTLDVNSFDDDDIFESTDENADEPVEGIDDLSFLEDDTVSPPEQQDENLDIIADISNSYEEKEQEKNLDVEQQLFDQEHHDEESMTSLPSEGSAMEGHDSLPRLDDDELFSDMFESKPGEEDDVFAQFEHEDPVHSRPPEIPSSSHYDEAAVEEPDADMHEEETTFSSEAFDDVNADFPESEQPFDMGDDQLFDYDATGEGHDTSPHAAATSASPHGAVDALKENFDHFMSKAMDFVHHPPGAGDTVGVAGGGPGAGGDAGASELRTKRIVRTAALLIMVVLVYSVLRLVYPSTNTTVVAEANKTSIADQIPKIDLGKATPTKTEPTIVAETEAKATGAEEFKPEAPAMPAVPAVASATPAVPVAAPAAPAVAVAASPPPAVAAPSETTTTTAAAPEAAPPSASTGMQLSHEEKVQQLENAINNMDQRLATLAQQPGTTGLTVDNTSGVAGGEGSAPRTQQILSQALTRIDELDKKLSLLADLQKEIKNLNTQVQALKSDIVQQSMIVGQAQREINTGLQVFKTDNPEPVRMMVQAAIPGRAWIRSEAGELYTVIPGDEVPGYGKVVSIDAGTGTVVMSSRAVIREQF